MKSSLSAIAAAFLLAACAGGSTGSGVSLGIGLGGMLGNHVGIGTSVNIPINNNQPEKINTQAIEQPTIYFDAQGKHTDSATKGGYRRNILTKQSDGTYLVQDFYEMGGTKRTDPMQLTAAQLHTFRATPDNGTLTVYAINGAVMQQQTFQNGKLIK